MGFWGFIDIAAIAYTPLGSLWHNSIEIKKNAIMVKWRKDYPVLNKTPKITTNNNNNNNNTTNSP
jgi:hypothetical protein